jgi:hypothetical protein
MNQNQEVINFLNRLIREAESMRHRLINKGYEELMEEIETTLKGSVEPRADRGEPDAK